MTTTTTEQRVPHQIPCAHDILDTELTRTTNERDALRQFRARCTQLEPTTPPPASQSQATSSAFAGIIQSVTSGSQTSNSGTLQRVYDAYRETVMALDHYDDEYDEPLDENLAAEVGEELASAITTGEYFPPQIKQNLDQTIRQCMATRGMLLDDLAREQEALEAAETTITETLAWLRERNERPMGKWSLTERYRTYETLLEYEAECDALAAARQETVQNKRTVVARTDSRLFNDYLYESLEVTHPVLADLATLASLLEEARHRLERTLIP